MSGLTELPGLETISEQLARAIAVIRAELARQDASVAVARPAWKNLVFTGGPGSGKVAGRQGRRPHLSRAGHAVLGTPTLIRKSVTSPPRLWPRPTSPNPAKALMPLIASVRLSPAGESEGQNQDQEGHGRQAWRLPKTLRGTEIAGEPDTLLVIGSLIVPDTEEATSSNLVPPTSSRRSAAFSAPRREGR